PAVPLLPTVSRPGALLEARLRFLRFHEVLGDLPQEARGWVVAGLSEQGPAPRVREVQALLRACDPHVRQPPLLLELCLVGHRTAAPLQARRRTRTPVPRARPSSRQWHRRPDVPRARSSPG